MKHILILIDTSRGSGRKFLVGVEKYTAGFTQWQVIIRPPDYLLGKKYQSDAWFPLKNIDGILVRDAASTQSILRLKKPKVVYDTQQEVMAKTSSIVTASLDIGQMAAEYFVGLGFRHFAYCGFKKMTWSQKRHLGFKEKLSKHGIEIVYDYETNLQRQHYLNELKKITQWLMALPKPLAVFACNDDRAIHILEACKVAGLGVPEEVAVLGVDNDELVCNLSSPSLSSIELDFERIGFLAAQHLDRLIQKKEKIKHFSLSPKEIIKRQSTDTLAIADESVVLALRYIRENFYKSIQALDVVNATSFSRRELEKRFKTYTKNTIKGEIERLRIEMVKKKLLNSSQPLYQIANDLAFTDPEHFSRYFKNATGKTPLQFRRQYS